MILFYVNLLCFCLSGFSKFYCLLVKPRGNMIVQHRQFALNRFNVASHFFRKQFVSLLGIFFAIYYNGLLIEGFRILRNTLLIVVFLLDPGILSFNSGRVFDLCLIFQRFLYLCRLLVCSVGLFINLPLILLLFAQLARVTVLVVLVDTGKHL